MKQTTTKPTLLAYRPVGSGNKYNLLTGVLKYRDWEHPLKIEQHKAYAFDTDKSYTEYLSTINTEENGND